MSWWQEACPWASFPQQIDKYPFCEERICSWVVEPANTWTNIGYLIVALVIWRNKTKGSPVRELFMYSSLFLFFGSFAFHGTGTVVGKILDVSAMYVLSIGVLTISLQTLLNLSKRTAILFYTTILTVCVLFLVLTRGGYILFSLQVFLVLFAEFKLHRKKTAKLNPKYLLGSAAALSIAFSFWVADVSHGICDPNNHVISGHGIWHLLTASSIYLLFLSHPNKVL